jgi:serine/threonine protein phosphatase PrpC
MKQPLRTQRRLLLSGMLALYLALGASLVLGSAASAAGMAPRSARSFTIPVQEGVALAQIATVRVVAHYGLTYTVPPSTQSNLTVGTCTGLGVLVQSAGTTGTPADATYLLTTSEVLASDLACPTISKNLLPVKAITKTVKFEGADVFLSRAYLGQTVAATPLFIVPPTATGLPQALDTPQTVLVALTPATGKLTHDYPTVALSSAPSQKQVYLDLYSTANAPLSSNQLNAGPATPQPSVSPGDFLVPSQPLPTTTPGSPGAPIINEATGAVEGLLKSDGTALPVASVTLPNTINACPGQPAVEACLTNRWKAAMDAYYGASKHDLSKLQALTTDATYQDFQGAQDFLTTARAAISAGNDAVTPTPSTSEGSSILGALDLSNPVTIALIVLVALLVLVFIMTLLISVRRLRRKNAQPEAKTAAVFPVRSKVSGQLSPVMAPPPPAQAPAAAAFESMPPQGNAPGWRTIICPRCNAQNNQGSSVCFNCGLDLPQGAAGTSGVGRSLGRSTSGGPAPLPLPSLTPPPPGPDVAEMPTHIFQPPASGRGDNDSTLPTMPAVTSNKQEEPTVVARGRTRPPLGLKVSTKTDTGRRRKDNEDNFLSVIGTWRHNGQLQPFGIFVIADGMGGHANGQDASRIAVETIYQHLSEALPSRDTPDDALGVLLQESIQRANQMIYQQNQKDHADMGCTMTAALVTGHEAHICNVGDSRTYLLNPSAHLLRVTTDHSIVESLVAAGVIQKDDVYTHPKRNQIYRSLGEKEAAEIDIFRQPLTPGDKLLLCCDGLWEMVRDPDIEQVLRHDDLPHVTNTLIDMANENGGVDNITAIVVKVMEDARPAKQPMIQSVDSGPANLNHSQR